MKRQFIALLVPLLLPIMAACQGGTPTPTLDPEAYVSAAVQATIAAQLTPTAAEILAMSRVRMKEVRTLRVDLRGRLEQGFVGFPFRAEGGVELPDRAQGTFQGFGEQREFLSLGEEGYLAKPGTGFGKTVYQYGSPFLELQEVLWLPTAEEPFTELVRQPDETIEGQDFYDIAFQVDMAEFIQRVLDRDLQGAEITAGGEVFISQESLLPHRFVISCERCIPFSGVLDLIDTLWDLTMDLSLGEFNQPVRITSTGSAT